MFDSPIKTVSAPPKSTAQKPAAAPNSTSVAHAPASSAPAHAPATGSSPDAMKSPSPFSSLFGFMTDHGGGSHPKSAAAPTSAPAAHGSASSAPAQALGSPAAAPAPHAANFAPGGQMPGRLPFAQARQPPVEDGDVKIISVDFEHQGTGYTCGPASARIALSARMDNLPAEGTENKEDGSLAQDLLVDPSGPRGGTPDSGNITAVLNKYLANDPNHQYQTKRIQNDPSTNDPSTPAQRDQLWNDIVADVDNNYAIVANIHATTNNHPPGYEGHFQYGPIDHYLTIIGYRKSDQSAYIADPAGFGGEYWIPLGQLVSMIIPHGYSA